MSLSDSCHTPTQHRPALAWFSAIGSTWVFVLVTLGAFTTSIGAGMAFPDWPLSNGSLNPDGWLTNIAKFAEHSHRLSGATMGLITLTLAVWLHRVETRAWMRRLGWSALGMVVIQGIIGGQRVKLDAISVPGFTMTLGQMLRIPHGIIAQIFVCTLFALAWSLSKGWIQPSGPIVVSKGIRRLSIICTTAVFIQLIVAAIMRHNYAGLAIPTFPLTPQGGLVPETWSFKVGIHFAHRVMAFILSILIPWLVAKIWLNREINRGLKDASSVLFALLIIQVTLGAITIWTQRNPYFATAHVIVGALLFATAFSLSWWCLRNRLECASEQVKS